MKRTKKGVVILTSVLLIGLALPLVTAAQHEKPEPAKDGTMQDMQKCLMTCIECCEKNMKNTSEAIALLDEAVKATEMGNAAEAKMKIEKANMLLKDMHIAQKKCMEKMPAANDRCPITGKKINRMDAPENPTALYKGKKIGFCSLTCLPLWDRLTDQEKDQKLEKVMPQESEKEEHM